MKLSDRIRRARKLAGMSQKQVAEALGVQRSTVANWESVGEITPGADRLHRLASACNVSFEWLATGRGEMGLPGHVHDMPAVENLLVLEDLREIRLVLAWRSAPGKVKVNLLELAEMHASPASSRNSKPLAR